MRREFNLMVLIFCMAMVALLAGCGQKEVSNSTEQGGLEVKEITAWGVIDPQISAQQIIAKKMGFFKEEGLEVTNKLQQSGTEIGPMVAGGSAQVSFESTYTDISLASNNISMTLIAPMANIGGTQAVVASSGLDINSAQDLEGLKIGMAPGSGVLIAIRKMADELGVDINSFKFVKLQPADQIIALEKGDIDLMACWEPWVSKAIALDGKILFSGLKSYLPENKGDVNYLNFHTILQVTNDMLKYPETLKAFLRALVKATDYINNNREEAAAILSEELNIEKEELLGIMSRNIYSLQVDSDFVDGITEMATFMKEMDNISKIPQVLDFVDFSLLKEVDKDLVKVDLK